MIDLSNDHSIPSKSLDSTVKPQPCDSEGSLLITPEITQKVFDIITNKTRKKGSVMWVVMDKYRTTTLMVPGTNQAFGSHQKKHVELVAKETGGVVEALGDAMHYVCTSPCNLPTDHPAYNKDKKAPKIKLPRFK